MGKVWLALFFCLTNAATGFAQTGDYAPTAGTGLNLNVASGYAVCGSPPSLQSYTASTVGLTASTTNYVYLDRTSGTCAPTANTTGFGTGVMPIAVVATGSSTITSVTDVRGWFRPNACGSVDSDGNVTCTALSNGNITLTPAGSGTILTPTFNKILYADAYSGGDVGAQITNAISACGPGNVCEIVVAPGTVSSPPDVPYGYTISFSPGTYALNATWYIQHRKTVWQFNGAQFNVSSSVGWGFVVGKYDASGGAATTVNTTDSTHGYGTCSSDCVSWVSGTDFSDIDPDDVVLINGAGYNVAAKISTTLIQLTASAGTQTSASFYGLMVSNVDQSQPSVTMRDAVISGNGSSTGGLWLNGVVGAFVSNVNVGNFSAGTGMLLQGVLKSEFEGLKFTRNATHLALTTFTNFSGANLNVFIAPILDSSATAGGYAIEAAGSSDNHFLSADVEGNSAKYAVNLDFSSQHNVFQNCDFEGNGGAQVGSADIYNDADGTAVQNTTFSNTGAHDPDYGFYNAAGAGVRLESLKFNGGYAANYNFVAGTSGCVVNASTGTAAGCVEDGAGNNTVKSLTSTGNITTTGDVGIGTTSPQAPLNIAGTKVELYDPSQSGNNYSYFKTTAATFNTQTLTLGTTQGYSTPVDALSVYNGSVTVARSLAAGVNPVSYSLTPTFDLSAGNVQQFTCTATTGVTVDPSFINLTKGELVTFIFVQTSSGTACALTWPTSEPGAVHGGGTPSSVHSSVNVQTFAVSNDGSDLYATGPMQSCTTSCGTP